MFALLLFTGLAVGLISAFFGVGGGIITVPMLYTIFSDISPQTVIGSSLGLIFLNSVLNTRNFIKIGRRPEFSHIILMGLFMMAGVIVGGKFNMTLEPNTIKTIFAAFAGIIGIRTFFSTTKALEDDNWEPSISKAFYIKAAFTGLLGGVISGLTGLGGGAILVPLFITQLHMPIKWVPVYSNATMAMGTLAGLFTYMMVPTPKVNLGNGLFQTLQVGYINFGIILILFAGAFITSRYGVKFVQKVSAKRSKQLFAFLLWAVSIKIILNLYVIK
jgi:uncharacterized membrane protein YfcA